MHSRFSGVSNSTPTRFRLWRPSSSDENSRFSLNPRFRPSLIIVFPDPKMNVSGSKKKRAYLIEPKLAIFQASIFGIFFRPENVHFRFRKLYYKRWPSDRSSLKSGKQGRLVKRGICGLDHTEMNRTPVLGTL